MLLLVHETSDIWALYYTARASSACDCSQAAAQAVRACRCLAIRELVPYSTQIPAHDRTTPDAAGLDEDWHLTVFVLVSGRSGWWWRVKDRTFVG